MKTSTQLSKLLIGLIVWHVTTNLAAPADPVPPLRSPEDCVRFTDALMPLVVRRQGTNVYAAVHPHYLKEVDRAKLVKIFDTTAVLDGLIGKQTGFERGPVRAYASSILVVRYLEKHETGALLWTFRFYRPKDAWRIDGVGIEGQEIGDLMKEIEPAEWTTLEIK